MSKPIDSFTGTFRYLSNFAYTPLRYDGLHFLSAEAAYQAAKCANPADKLEFSHLSPREAKAKGRIVPLREDWEEAKINIMEEIVRVKFQTYPVFAQGLVATSPRLLIEGNTWGDTFWGVCDGEGKNYLGILLMQVRHELLSERGL